MIGEFIENELVEKYNLVRQSIPVKQKEDDEEDNNVESRIYLRYLQNKKTDLRNIML